LQGIVVYAELDPLEAYAIICLKKKIPLEAILVLYERPLNIAPIKCNKKDTEPTII
jgi:hypothetical protein